MAKKVVLGLSGGVDSSVAAIKLMEDGFDVRAVFMRNWDSALNNDILGNPNDFSNVCPQEVDYMDAKDVAEKLGIPFERIDFVEEYWRYVFSYFLSEYQKGRTPNPDLICNKEIKFKAFLDYAIGCNADYIAMGHYARVIHDHARGSFLLRGVDKNKDQSYFLAFLSQNQLKKALFPIGEMEKKDVRKIAEAAKLGVAQKKDSTGICFIGERNFHQFLQNYLPAKEGVIKTVDGDVIGSHDGLMYYTIGQRKGLNIGGLAKYSNEAWYVCGKDLENNILYVAQGFHNLLLYGNSCLIDEINWINEKPIENYLYTAKFRYREHDNEITLKYISENEVLISCKDNVRAITPGQACVIYDNEYCLGGGIIKEVYIDGKKRPY